ncbi:MAG: spore coat associated protein CotJA [Peptococcaceae bacterium]|nr:spore coat associated protein CotJA [Peptococcaceae bacterium]
MARPRPPANPTGPYYPPGPPTGPYIPPEPPGYPPTAGWELARAYVPIQRFGTTYSPAEALEKGTLFPELWRPYQGR